MAEPASAKVDPRRYHEAAPVSREGRTQQLPVCLYLETTNRCNLLCTTCPRTYAELEPPADMSWALFTSIVEQLPTLQRAVLHGVGEPMLVKNLPAMVRHLKDLGVYVLFNTNGTVLTEKSGRAMIEAGLDELRVSLDASNAASYKAIRGKDYFDRILRNVRRFVDLQRREGHEKPRVSAWLTGMKENVAGTARLRPGRGERRREGGLFAAAGILRDRGDRSRPPGPGPVRKPVEPGSRVDRRGGGDGTQTRRHVSRLRRGIGAGHEPEAVAGWIAVVAVPPAMDRHVRHGQRPRFAVLYRTVFAARL